MKEKPLSHEEVRQAITDEYEARIEEMAVKIATQLWPEQDVSVVVEKLTPQIRKAVFDGLPAEQKLYLIPTSDSVS